MLVCELDPCSPDGSLAAVGSSRTPCVAFPAAVELGVVMTDDDDGSGSESSDESWSGNSEPKRG